MTLKETWLEGQIKQVDEELKALVQRLSQLQNALNETQTQLLVRQGKRQALVEVLNELNKKGAK